MEVKTSFLSIYSFFTSDFYVKLHTEKILDPYFAYKMQRILKKVGNYGQDIEKSRMEIIKKYYEPILDKNGKPTNRYQPTQEPILDKDGKETGQYQLNKEKYEEFTKVLKSFLKKEDVFNFEYFLSLEDLEDIEITPEKIGLIDFLLNKEDIENYFKKNR